jgi:hypothetical protein
MRTYVTKKLTVLVCGTIILALVLPKILFTLKLLQTLCPVSAHFCNVKAGKGSGLCILINKNPFNIQLSSDIKAHSHYFCAMREFFVCCYRYIKRRVVKTTLEAHQKKARQAAYRCIKFTFVGR